MSKISYSGFLLAGVLMLQGCATSPGATYESRPGHKVGVLNLVEEDYTHTHIGTTVFNNKVSSHGHSRFNVPEYITDSVIDKLQARGLEPVVIRREDWPTLVESDLVSMGWNDYRIRPEHLDELESLMAQKDLSLLLVFESFRRQDHIGGSSVHVGGYGLYTRSFLGAGSARAYSNIWGYGIRSNPVAYVAAAGTGSTREVEFRTLNDSTIQELETAIQPLIEEIVNNTFQNVGIE